MVTNGTIDERLFVGPFMSDAVGNIFSGHFSSVHDVE